MALFDRPAVLAGAGAALAGWGIVAVPVLLLWVATPYADGDLTAVPRLAAALWLLAHGGPLHWAGAGGHSTLGVAPLLVTALAVGLVHHAAARTGRRAEVLVGYLGVAAPAALLGLGSEPQTEPVPDLLWAAVLALLAAMAGARRTTGEWGVAVAWRLVRARGEWLGVWPVSAPDGGAARRLERARTLAPQGDEALRAGLAGAMALLGGGAAVLAVSILAHLGAAGALAALLAPDLAGRLSLMLLCVVLVPNAAIWSAAYALGTGFTLGGHAAALGTQPLAPLALPLLADAPAPGRSVFGLVALAVPLVSGGVVGWALTCGARLTTGTTEPDAADAKEHTDPDDHSGLGGRAEARDVTARRGRTELTLVVLAASACTGLIAGAGALWAGGTLGDSVLAEVGPPVGWTALAAFGWTFLVALPTAFLIRWSSSRTKAHVTEAAGTEASEAVAPAAAASRGTASKATASRVTGPRAWSRQGKALKTRTPQTKPWRPSWPFAVGAARGGGSVLAEVTDDVDWGFPAEQPIRSGPELALDLGPWPGPDPGPGPTPGSEPGSGSGPVSDSESDRDLESDRDPGGRPDLDPTSGKPGQRNPAPAAQ